MSESPTTLAHYTSNRLIVPRLRVRGGTAGVIGELCSALEREGRIGEPLPFYNTALSHELVCSTATSPGWALPHARVKGLRQLSFALGRSATDLDWLEQGQQSVRMVFLFAIPEDEAAAYLSLISGLARLSQDPVRLQGLLDAPDSEGMLEVLRQIPLRQPRCATARN